MRTKSFVSTHVLLVGALPVGTRPLGDFPECADPERANPEDDCVSHTLRARFCEPVRILDGRAHMNNHSEQAFDVLVAGGGSAGVAAAVASARSGARTLLLERCQCLGGASTLRNVVTYCGLYTLNDAPKRVVGGIGAEVIAALRARGAITPPLRHRGVFAVFDPEAVKLVLDDLCARAGVEVMFSAMVVDADRTEDRITSVTVADHDGLRKIHARTFVDCTGEGDLAAHAGASVRYGNADGVNLGTLGTRFGGITPQTVVSAEDIAAAVSRIDPNRSALTKDRSVIARMPISGDLVCYLASADYDPRDAASLSAAECSGRQQAWRYLDALRTIPGCEQAYLVSTGPEFGTREARHIESQQPLCWAHVANRTQFSDTIALGAWGAEWHDRQSYVSTFEYPPDKAAYEIPLSCLRSRDTANLLAAGRVVDGDRLAGAAIRVMGTAFALGHAAGVAAALDADRSDWSARDVQANLRTQGAILDPASLEPA